MLIFDGHCDSLSRYTDISLAQEHTERQFDFTQMQGLSWVQVMAIFSWKANRNSIIYDDFLLQQKRLRAELPVEMHMLQQKQEFQQISANIPAIVLAVEGAEFLENRLDRLEEMYQLGVRMFGLTWNNDNFLAGGCEHNQYGLTQSGKDAVRMLNRMGMVVDCAHLSHQGLKEVLAQSEKPIVVSHTACDALCSHPRNLRDDEIREIANTGGLIGVAFVKDFLYSGGDRNATVADVVAHICHIAELVGCEHIALGSDFDGVDIPLSGLERAAMVLRLPAYFRAMGFVADEIEMMMGLNWQRVFLQQS